MDPLSDVLRAVRLKSGVFLDVRFTEPWCVYSQFSLADCSFILDNPAQVICYHYMTVGRMLAHVEGMEPIGVEAGEIVLLPRNERHILASAPGVPPVEGRDLVRPSPEGNMGRVVHGGGGKPAEMVCGFLGSDDNYNPLIASLPPIIKISVAKAAARAMIEASTLYAVNELAEGRMAAGGTMLAKLAELLFIEAVRSYAETVEGRDVPWLKGLGDPQIGPVLAAMHRDLGKPWTAEELAGIAAMSRSAFMGRFSGLVGESPIRYLTRWRMTAARRKLASSQHSIAQIAFDVGYESEDTFARAFKREHGISPGRFRLQAA